MSEVVEAKKEVKKPKPIVGHYRVNRGTHSEGYDPVTGKPLIYRRGQVVASTTDLLKLNNRDNKNPKFTKVNPDDHSQEAAVPLASVQDKPSKQMGPKEEGLSQLTVEELKALAADEEIDLGSTTKKADIIAKMLAVMGE